MADTTAEPSPLVCAEGELKILDACAHQMEIIVPLACVFAFFVLLSGTYIGVILYRRMNPEEHQKNKQSSVRRQELLWTRQQSLDMESEVEGSHISNEQVEMYMHVNPVYETTPDADYDHVSEDRENTANNYVKRSDTKSSRDSPKMNGNGRAPDEDPYMAALELTATYKDFAPDLAVVSLNRNTKFYVPRPKLKEPSVTGSVRSAESRFSGDEMHI